MSLIINDRLKLKATTAQALWVLAQYNNRRTYKERENFLKTAVESAGDNGWNRWEESEDNANGLRMELDDSKLELLLCHWNWKLVPRGGLGSISECLS